MIITECKSNTGYCPCLWCNKLVNCGPCTVGKFDTESLCAEAREYCEKVNCDGREEDKSSM